MAALCSLPGESGQARSLRPESPAAAEDFSCGHFPEGKQAQKRQLRSALAGAKIGHLRRFGQIEARPKAGNCGGLWPEAKIPPLRRLGPRWSERIGKEPRRFQLKVK